MIKIVIVHEDNGLRRKLRALISATPDMEIVREVRTAIDAVDMAWKLKPDVLLLSADMQGPLNSFVTAVQIHGESPKTKVIFLTKEDALTMAEKGVDVLEKCQNAGARGYITTDSPDGEFLDGIRQVMLGHNYYCVPAIMGAVRRMCDRAVRLAGE